MLAGRVNRDGEPVVPIQLILRNRPVSLRAVIDTGFNGYLCAPRRLLSRGRWEAIGTEKFEIATGDLVRQEIYLGEVIFNGWRGLVYTVGTNTKDILIGTKLLREKILSVNFQTKRLTIK